MASGKSDNNFDDILVTIAKTTRQDAETDDLGKALGIPIHDIEPAKVENRHGITHMGTLNMLRSWRKGQLPSKEGDNLRAALKKANMIRLLNEVFPEAGTVNPSAPSTCSKVVPIDDLKLDRLGDALGDDPTLKTLGLNLGFPEPQVKMFLATNRVDGMVSSRGTKNMLSAWRNKTSGANQVQELRNALIKSNLCHIAETYLNDLEQFKPSCE